MVEWKRQHGKHSNEERYGEAVQGSKKKKNTNLKLLMQLFSELRYELGSVFFCLAGINLYLL